MINPMMTSPLGMGTMGAGQDPYAAMNSLMAQTTLAAKQAEMQMAVMIALLATGGASGNSAGGGGISASNPSFGGGSSNGNSGVSSFLGASPAASGGGSGGSGSGQAAVDLARKFNGKDSISLKGKMPHFTAAGGTNNNCADFVSSALESQGLIKGHHINVKSMEQELKKQGYVQVPASQAKPGDVWISNSRGHTELVATKGATRLIGSNNNGDSRQEITEHANRPGSGVIYQKR